MKTKSELKEEIEETINLFFHSMDVQDYDLMNEIIAHDEDMVNIGTDEDEFWERWEILRKATIEQFEGLEYYQADIKNLKINLSSTGIVAWYFHKLDARIKSRGSETKLHDARFTGVMEKRNGKWKMVQTHLSLPID